MTIRKSSKRDDPEAVLAAFQFIKGVFESAESVEYKVGEIDGVPQYDVVLRIPGTGEIVDLNDSNTLGEFADWIASEAMKRLTGEEIA